MKRHPSMAFVSMLLVASIGIPVIATAHPMSAPKRIVGQYFLSDDQIDLAGGALLYSDCSQDGSVVAAIPAGPNRIVAELTATYWINDPDPSLPPYNQWPVPEELDGMPRLLLCYDFDLISGPDPGFDEFCDWAPRDMRGPLEVDFEPDGVRDLLISVTYQGGPKRCADR